MRMHVRTRVIFMPELQASHTQLRPCTHACVSGACRGYAYSTRSPTHIHTVYDRRAGALHDHTHLHDEFFLGVLAPTEYVEVADGTNQRGYGRQRDRDVNHSFVGDAWKGVTQRGSAGEGSARVDYRRVA